MRLLKIFGKLKVLLLVKMVLLKKDCLMVWELDFNKTINLKVLLIN